MHMHTRRTTRPLMHMRPWTRMYKRIVRTRLSWVRRTRLLILLGTWMRRGRARLALKDMLLSLLVALLHVDLFPFTVRMLFALPLVLTIPVCVWMMIPLSLSLPVSFTVTVTRVKRKVLLLGLIFSFSFTHVLFPIPV